MSEKVFYGKGVRRIKEEDPELYGSIEEFDKNISLDGLKGDAAYLVGAISLFEASRRDESYQIDASEGMKEAFNIKVGYIQDKLAAGEEITQEDLQDYIKEKVLEPIIPEKLIDNNTKVLINTSGSFTIGGPFGDSGTTGRKIVVDTYGGFSKVGGGCFSSKDPSKVDRSAAYYARYVAKNVVAHNFCDKCEIQLSYAIGKEYPISIYIDTFNTEKINKEDNKEDNKEEIWRKNIWE